MIRTLAVTIDFELLKDVPLDQLSDSNIEWYWVDFNVPTAQEGMALTDYFRFHPLAVEDCFHFLQRSKLDYYEGYNFFVIHALNQETLNSEELDMFMAENYIVTFHYKPLMEIEAVWQQVLKDENVQRKGVAYLAYMIMDHLVDGYFPVLHQIEDQLNMIEHNDTNRSINTLLKEVFSIRGDLLKLRRIIVPMRDLLYRVLNSERLPITKAQKAYFTDVYDHLLKLTEMVESNRDITSEIRDSYLSLNTNRMNAIMMTLTIISSIFIPLTFIAGVYGMNFENMPELQWEHGYYMVLVIMALIGIAMVVWFKRKGWFDIFK